MFLGVKLLRVCGLTVLFLSSCVFACRTEFQQFAALRGTDPESTAQLAGALSAQAESLILMRGQGLTLQKIRDAETDIREQAPQTEEIRTHELALNLAISRLSVETQVSILAQALTNNRALRRNFEAFIGHVSGQEPIRMTLDENSQILSRYMDLIGSFAAIEQGLPVFRQQVRQRRLVLLTALSRHPRLRRYFEENEAVVEGARNSLSG